MSHVRTRILRICIVAVTMLASSVGAETIERADLQDVFTRSGVIGTFVVFTPDLSRTIMVNPTRALQRFIPASTFKIANSLIALETGAVKDENEIIPYGGKPQPIKRWERDMSMREAIKISNVPVYQEIARRVGRRRYLKWLDRLNYGNRQVGQDVHSFWLEGPLKISPVEQVRFLTRLVAKELPASKNSQSTVIEILKLEQHDGKTLYGKTGWTNAPDPDIGWFVGWVTDGVAIHAFALNLDVSTRTDARQRKPLAKQLLRKLGIW